MCVRQMRPPGRGDFWILKNAYAPSRKNLSKNGLPQKGGSLCVKDVFAKKIFGAGRDSAGGAIAVLRKHSTEGRTPDAVDPQIKTKIITSPGQAHAFCRAADPKARSVAPASVDRSLSRTARQTREGLARAQRRSRRSATAQSRKPRPRTRSPTRRPQW
jgi:hypothetical protein